jgi:putative salt-induced outer membrane protein YdiY
MGAAQQKSSAMPLLAVILAASGLTASTPALAQGLPPGLEQLLREAQPKERDTIENVAKRTYPDQRQAIDDLIDKIEKQEETTAGKSSFVTGWTGEGSLGGNYSRGNADEWNVSAALNIKRETPLWEHKIEANIDFSDVNGSRTDERVSGAYRARRDFAKSPFFLFGALSYDRDRSQGIEHRFTESAGGGYEIIDKKGLDWDIYAGPALRQADFSDNTTREQIGAFIATDFKWDITDKLTLREYAGTVLAKVNKSFKTTTALTNNIYGALSVRFDFTIDSETDPPLDAENTDIYSRFSLVYGF